MIVGYARTSTVDQTAGLSAQLAALKKAGVERIYQEHVSSMDRDARTKFNEAMEFIRDGDTFVVTKLDRLARSVAHLLEIIAQVEAKGVTLRILDMDLDTGTPTGRLMLNMLGAIVQFERELMLERQREGIARAKAQGKYKGRKHSIDRKRILDLHEAGHGPSKIATELGIGRTTVYRVLNDR